MSGPVPQPARDLYPHGLWVGQEWEHRETGERARVDVIDAGMDAVEVSGAFSPWRRTTIEDFVASFTPARSTEGDAGRH